MMSPFSLRLDGLNTSSFDELMARIFSSRPGVSMFEAQKSASGRHAAM
jgi:hypothetical protein